MTRTVDCMQTAIMPNVTIRDVPSDVHLKLVERAAAQGQSLQQYLLGVLSHEAGRLTMAEWLARVDARKAAEGLTEDLPVDPAEIIRELRGPIPPE